MLFYAPDAIHEICLTLSKYSSVFSSMRPSLAVRCTQPSRLRIYPPPATAPTAIPLRPRQSLHATIFHRDRFPSFFSLMYTNVNSLRPVSLRSFARTYPHVDETVLPGLAQHRSGGPAPRADTPALDGVGQPRHPSHAAEVFHRDGRQASGETGAEREHTYALKYSAVCYRVCTADRYRFMSAACNWQMLSGGTSDV